MTRCNVCGRIALPLSDYCGEHHPKRYPVVNPLQSFCALLAFAVFGVAGVLLGVVLNP